MVVCLYYKYCTKIYDKATIYANKLILTTLSPFDLKCKKRNEKNLWKCIFRASRRVNFSYFQKVALDLGVLE